MTKTRLKLIFSWPGARADFLCGWVGLLPNVIDHRWTVDPNGRSSIDSCFKNISWLDLDAISTYLAQQNLSLDCTGIWTTILPHHGENISVHNLNNIINFPAIQTYAIDHRTADLSTLKWDALVKTYLTPKKDLENIKHKTSWKIDKLINLVADKITDQIRTERILEEIKIWQNPIPDYYYLSRSDIPKLDYAELFQPGGSRYLCNIIDHEATERQHLFWDHMLKFATSPDEIECFGRVWRKRDYF